MPDRRIPLSVRPALKEELDRMMSLGVITPVNDHTPWVSQLVITLKKSGKLRVCIDPKDLNKALRREQYTLPILEDTLHELAQSRVFTKADLAQLHVGYWHVVLDDESSKLTTFNTCYGRYRWLRLPFGTCVSSEIFQKRLLQALQGLDGVICIADDIIVHGKDTDEHDKRLHAFLSRCREIGIKLNKEKLRLRTDSISFLGHLITAQGLLPDPDKVKAIMHMSPPTNVSELRTFIGMVNYMAKFLPNLNLKPLTNLTRKDIPWNWSTAQSEAFEIIKNQICSAPVLAIYDPSKELTLECDASEYGIGCTIRQEGKPVAYASRTLSSTECRYAQIEKEMLAIVFGLQKFHHYTFGRKTSVLSDHKPLIAIVKKTLSKAPKRLQSMLLRAQMYDFELSYSPGKTIPVADALSRAPLPSSDETTYGVNNLTFSPVKEKPTEEIRAVSQNDEEMMQLMKVITTGWPENKSEVPLSVKPYFSYRDELTVQDGLVLRGERLVVPRALRGKMKQKCHAGHLGINSTLRRARDVLYWPGMSQQIREYVETCGVCASMPAKQPEQPVICGEIPTRPWQRVGCDIMTFEQRNYLITTDCYSSYFEVDRLPDISAETVIKKTQQELFSLRSTRGTHY